MNFFFVTATSESNSCSIHNNNLNGIVTVTTTALPSTSNSINNNNLNRSQQPKINENVVAAQNISNAKKPRPKTSSPTRHGPQQCQVNLNLFEMDSITNFTFSSLK